MNSKPWTNPLTTRPHLVEKRKVLEATAYLAALLLGLRVWGLGVSAV